MRWRRDLTLVTQVREYTYSHRQRFSETQCEKMGVSPKRKLPPDGQTRFSRCEETGGKRAISQTGFRKGVKTMSMRLLVLLLSVLCAFALAGAAEVVCTDYVYWGETGPADCWFSIECPLQWFQQGLYYDWWCRLCQDTETGYEWEECSPPGGVPFYRCGCS